MSFPLTFPCVSHSVSLFLWAFPTLPLMFLPVLYFRSYADLNCLIDSASRVMLSISFHSLTQTEKKEYLKLSVLQENSGKFFLFSDPVLQVIRDRP